MCILLRHCSEIVMKRSRTLIFCAQVTRGPGNNTGFLSGMCTGTHFILSQVQNNMPGTTHTLPYLPGNSFLPFLVAMNGTGS
jgi:hypothetical protein